MINKKIQKLLLLVATLSCLGIPFASANEYCTYDIDLTHCRLPIGGGSGGSAKQTENRIYSGFVWEFGSQSLIPQFIIGVRSIQVKDNDHVNGGDLNLRIKYDNSISFDSVRLSYVGGKRDVMGNVGGGYSFTNSSWLTTAAIQSSYTRVGADYLFAKNKVNYYAELNTLEKPAKVMRPRADGTCTVDQQGVLTQVINGQLSNNGSPLLYNGSPVDVDPNQVLNGQTCYGNE